jgi:hypothetical protein
MTVLADDQGTSGTKAIVGSDDGAVLGIGGYPRIVLLSTIVNLDRMAPRAPNRSSGARTECRHRRNPEP